MKGKKLLIYGLVTILMMNIIFINGGEFLSTEDKGATFKDIKKGYWAEDAILSLANNNILSGDGSGDFRPNDYISRSEFTKVVVSLLQLDTDTSNNPFVDINSSKWYYDYVLTAYNNGIVSGVSSTRFDPGANITRQDVFTLLSRVLTDHCRDLNGQKVSLSTTTKASLYNDASSISSYANKPINTLLHYELISGYTNNTLRPKNYMTRAEASSMIYRLATSFNSAKDLNIEPEIVDPIEEPTTDIPSLTNPVMGQYSLEESTSSLSIWTDYPSERIFKTDAKPETVKSGINVYMAKNEFEPFQLILNPTSNKTITIEEPTMTSGLSMELHKVMYVNLSQSTDNMGETGLYPDPLYPVAFGEAMNLTKNTNQPLWFTIKTEETIAAGDYTVNLKVDGINVPVHIHVFDFAIPSELHVKSQINVSTNTILQKYGVTGTSENYWKYVDSFKQFMIDHRLTPKSALWSGGLTSSGGSPYIDYNSATGTLSDPHGIWGFEYPAHRYIDGLVNTSNSYLPNNTFNGGTGFPSFMAMTFRNNDASEDQRPSTFDGVTRSASDWYQSDNTSSAYNQKWFNYVGDIESYLSKEGYIDEAYYYMANEPQNQDDYDAVAWYTSKLKEAAPNLKLMVSEEPKPEIYNNNNYPNGKIDIWLPVLNNYDPVESWSREANHDEESWIYFLYGTKPPYFNPITLDHPGIESKLTGWFLWKYRLKGIAHYSFNNWSRNVWEDTMVSGHNGDDFMLYPPGLNNETISYGVTDHRFVTSIRFELMRDSLEDYEYLYVLNKSKQPEVYSTNTADSQVDKIIYGLTSYNRSSDYMYNLRKYIGCLVAGEITSIPEIDITDKHERAEDTNRNFYINFQDPNDSSVNEPLVVNDKTYTKIGWNTYDESLGYGWFGDMAHVKYQNVYNEANILKSTVIYDDWGREKTFEYDLPNGKYNVTISCGWAGRSYKHNLITIEGVSFINDEETNPYIEVTKQIEVKDNKLTMEMGIFDEYTMLNYMEIVGVE